MVKGDMNQIGDYKLIEKIGAGGMGEVWLAENVHMHLRYALKLLPKEATDDKNFVARFFDEGRVMAQLEHDHIVRVHHVGHDEKAQRYYLVMDYIAGPDGSSQSLHDVLAKSSQNRIAEGNARKWFPSHCSRIRVGYAKFKRSSDMPRQT